MPLAVQSAMTPLASVTSTDSGHCGAISNNAVSHTTTTTIVVRTGALLYDPSMPYDRTTSHPQHQAFHSQSLTPCGLQHHSSFAASQQSVYGSVMTYCTIEYDTSTYSTMGGAFAQARPSMGAVWAAGDTAGGGAGAPVAAGGGSPHQQPPRVGQAPFEIRRGSRLIVGFGFPIPIANTFLEYEEDRIIICSFITAETRSKSTRHVNAYVAWLEATYFFCPSSSYSYRRSNRRVGERISSQKFYMHVHTLSFELSM